MAVDTSGFRAAVVRLVDYRKEEFLDRHAPHQRPSAGKRPFLFLLAPDTLSLATAGDAADAASASSLLQMATVKRADAPPRPSHAGSKPLALLHKLAHHERSASLEGGGGGAAASDGGFSETRLLLDEGEGAPLEEGQLLSFDIALSQVVAVESEERRIKASARRHRRGAAAAQGAVEGGCGEAAGEEARARLAEPSGQSLSSAPAPLPRPTAGLFHAPEAAPQHRGERRLEVCG